MFPYHFQQSKLNVWRAVLVAGVLLVGLTVGIVSPHFARATSGPMYPAGAALIPLGDGQPTRLRNAYQGLFAAVYNGQPTAWTAVTSTYNSATYSAGTIVGLRGLSSDYQSVLSVPTDGSYTVERAHALRPARIAVFYSNVRDSANQVVTWEEVSFETLFRVYLWGDYFDTISETAIISGALSNYDLLILPSITIGYADEVSAALGVNGRAALADWVAGGGTIYAQGDGCYLVEAAGLVPIGTVNLNDRLTDEAPFDNLAHLRVDDAGSPLTFSWLSPTTYILDDPVLTATDGLTVVATYTDTTRPDTPAILFTRQGAGQIILTNAHPSDRQATYPLVLDAILSGMSERADLSGSAKQALSPAAADTVIPAYEAGVPISITTEMRDYWDADLTAVIVTETVRAGFTVNISDVIPAPTSFTTTASFILMTWDTSIITPGVTSFGYVARTLTDTLAKGWATVSTAEATFTDPLTGQPRHIVRPALSVQSKMAARLNGDRDIELDGLYPLPAEGYYFDVAPTLENKEETEARNIVITDVVPLLSPIVDVDDQNILPTVLTDTTTMSTTDETIWVANEIFFYNNSTYLLPVGVTNTARVFNLDNWDHATYYTYTGYLTNPVATIPVTYADYITVSGNVIRLPAVVLTWTFGTLQAYDYLDPAVRYGLFSRELLGRQVSFASDPMLNAGVVMNRSGGTVFTGLGHHPIPYHEYLSSGVINIPQPPYTTTVAYTDIWQRPHNMDLRTASYDIVPFPPPEYHAVVNTTYEMKVDWDKDGQSTDPVLEYPSRVPATLHLMLKSHSNFDPTMPPLRKDETLISQGMFKGLGFTLNPAKGTWENSWSFRNLQGLGADATVLTDVVTMLNSAYTYLYFQQELESQQYETIDITGTLNASTTHREGVMKINDGARFVYHQKAVGPSRYEVFDSHVQAVFGLRSDAAVTKQVAPVRVATYDDTVYHFIKVEDPWEPRLFTDDPFIQSYGFGDMAATVYVGGRHERDLLWSRVNPGEATQVRVEINNNTGYSLTNVSVIPSTPPGITVTLRSYTETTQIEPLFFDFPFLNTPVISDAWKGVYYFDVQVADSFPGPRGQVYPITFTLTGDNIPAYFHIPPAQLGIKDSQGEVRTVFGPATNLSLTDRLPPWVTLRDARLANAAEMSALVSAINYDDAHIDSDTAGTLYATLRDGIDTLSTTTSAGAQVTFTLPAYAQTIPWQDGTELAKTLYVILRSDLAIDWSGTAIADHAPVITYTDPFSQTQTSTGAARTVEAHGPALTVNYAVQDVSGNWSPGESIPANVRSDVLIDSPLVNGGDDIASGTLVTYTLPWHTIPISATPAWQSVTTDTVTWYLGDLGPGVRRALQITLAVTPTLAEIGTQRVLIVGANSRFINNYAQRMMTAHIGNALTIGVHSHCVYLPLIVAPARYPDLVVNRLIAASNEIQVVIKNLGPAPVTDEFWVDAYLDPNPPPTRVNQTWDQVSQQGVVWGVTSDALPLAAGGEITLTVSPAGGSYYWPSLSAITWPLTSETTIYAQVDSANTDTNYGGVLETHEIMGGPYNNISGPIYYCIRCSSAAAVQGPYNAITGPIYPTDAMVDDPRVPQSAIGGDFTHLPPRP
jgi:hypothetical protein